MRTMTVFCAENCLKSTVMCNGSHKASREPDRLFHAFNLVTFPGIVQRVKLTDTTLVQVSRDAFHGYSPSISSLIRSSLPKVNGRTLQEFRYYRWLVHALEMRSASLAAE